MKGPIKIRRLSSEHRRNLSKAQKARWRRVRAARNAVLDHKFKVEVREEEEEH